MNNEILIEMKKSVNYLLLLAAVLLSGCHSGSDFGAYYTRVDSGADFEVFERVREHPDIVARLTQETAEFRATVVPGEPPPRRWFLDYPLLRFSRADGGGPVN